MTEQRWTQAETATAAAAANDPSLHPLLYAAETTIRHLPIQ